MMRTPWFLLISTICAHEVVPIGLSGSCIFITPRSHFDNTLNFDITLMLNGRDCVVISLDISFYTSVTFRLHFSMSN